MWGIHRDRRIPRTKGQLRGKNVSIWWRHHVWSMFSLNLICHGFPVGTSSRLTVCNIIPYRVVQPDNSISNRRIYQSSVVFVPTKQQGKMSFCWFWKLLYNSPSPPTDYVILHFQSSSYSIKQLYNSLLLIGQRLSWLLVISMRLVIRGHPMYWRRKTSGHGHPWTQDSGLRQTFFNMNIYSIAIHQVYTSMSI